MVDDKKLVPQLITIKVIKSGYMVNKVPLVTVAIGYY